MSAIPTAALQTKLKQPIYKELHFPARPASKFTGKRVHFVGVGGSGMSGLARMLLDCGAIVSGSDAKPNRQTFELRNSGATISHDQKGELLDPQIDLVVRTAAVKDAHPEMQRAASLGLATMKYAELLGEIMQERYGVAVAGTHGKSTTTAMTAFALMECGLDPSFVVGGTIPQLGSSGSRSGAGDAFVAEACEFDRSFHNLAPTVALITNIEEDHLDCYKDIYDICASFRHFIGLVPQEGLVIANGRDPNVAKVIKDSHAAVQTCSLGADTTWSTQPRGTINGCWQGQVCFNGRPVATLRMSVPGEHNLLNATMALAAAHACGADLQTAADAIGRFTGVDRRMTDHGLVNGARIVDDYGHHPTEVRTTLKALRERYVPRRLICVFQPHQHSRTRHLLNDFAASFSSADLVIMPDIYFVRDSEEERRSVCAEDLVRMINEHGQEALHIPSLDAIVEHLRTTIGADDLVVTMGAGNVNEVALELVAK